MDNFLRELKELENSEEFFHWMWLLDGSLQNTNKTKEIVDNIREYGICGYCEDVALYFYMKYKNVEIIQTDYHFCIKYNKKYYDSFNRNGVNNLRDLEFFKRNNISNFCVDIYDKYSLPDYYYELALGFLPLANRIYKNKITKEG